MRLFQGFALAFSMLSIIPFFRVHTFFKGINGYSAMFYPVIGFLLGSVLYFTHLLLEEYLPQTHLSVIIFALWVLITGGIHLDGLSDTVDGLFVDKSKALEVMKDSHIGGMGMIFSALFLLLKLSSLIHYQAYYLLPIILMFSRLNATLALYFYNYVSSGVGTIIKDELNIYHILFALLFALGVAYLFSSMALSILMLFVLLVSGYFFSKRLGGLNGDIYGFIIEMSELFALNYLIVTLF